jgi:hypothetical protein
MVEVTIYYKNIVLPVFEVGKAWLVSHLCHEIAIVLGLEAPNEYNFVMEEEGRPNTKICYQQSCNYCFEYSMIPYLGSRFGILVPNI